MTKIDFARIRYLLFVVLLLGMPLSKYPSFAMPAFNFTSFRVGLYQLAAVLFVLLCSWPTLIKTKALYKQNKLVVVSVFVFAAAIIAGWFSAINTSRSLLLSFSIFFLLSLFLAGWWFVRYELKPSSYPLILRLVVWAGIFYGGLALLQFIQLTFTSNTLGIACSGCTAQVFGFPRVNLFAAEPQFLANALLPFFFATLALCYKKRSRLNLLAFGLLALTIGLTFSRGAYIAIVVGLIFFAALLAVTKNLALKKYLLLVGIAIVCALASFGLMIASASWRHRDTPNITYNTTKTIFEHVTLGLIVLPEKTTNVLPVISAPGPIDNFVSPGLVESSTTDRLSAADLALQAWRSNYKTQLMGVGTGNLGPYVVKNIQASAPNNLTVYIYYVLLLAEVGLIGLAAFLLIHFCALYSLIKLAFKNGSLIYAFAATTLIAFLVQYFFFGTFINVIYVWLFTGACLGLSVLPKLEYNIDSDEK